MLFLVLLPSARSDAANHVNSGGQALVIGAHVAAQFAALAMRGDSLLGEQVDISSNCLLGSVMHCLRTDSIGQVCSGSIGVGHAASIGINAFLVGLWNHVIDIIIVV